MKEENGEIFFRNVPPKRLETNYMPGFLLHANAIVMCAHGGQAQPLMPFPRVTVSGNPIATMVSPHIVTGCPFVPTGGNGPCVTAQWLVGATRILAGGMPVLLQSSVATCVPTATSLNIILTQTRASGL